MKAKPFYRCVVGGTIGLKLTDAGLEPRYGPGGGFGFFAKFTFAVATLFLGGGHGPPADRRSAHRMPP
jgi:hypothetical protein